MLDLASGIDLSLNLNYTNAFLNFGQKIYHVEFCTMQGDQVSLPTDFSSNASASKCGDLGSNSGITPATSTSSGYYQFALYQNVMGGDNSIGDSYLSTGRSQSPTYTGGCHAISPGYQMPWLFPGRIDATHSRFPFHIRFFSDNSCAGIPDLVVSLPRGLKGAESLGGFGGDVTRWDRGSNLTPTDAIIHGQGAVLTISNVFFVQIPESF